MKNINQIYDDLKAITKALSNAALKAENAGDVEKVEKIDASIDYIESALIHLDTIRNN